MTHTVASIARALGLAAEGETGLVVTGVAEPALAGPGDLAFAGNPKYADDLAQGQARAALLWAGADWRGLGLAAAILAARPRHAMAGISRLFDPGPEIAPGIHPSAVIDSGAQIGDGAAIGAFVVIGRGVRIGPRARIGAHTSIAEGCIIGADALLHARVTICARVEIGDRFICQSGAVIGGDGFSFVTPEKSGVEEVRETLGHRSELRPQVWARIHSLGGVVIGDDVEVGANSAIDRGTVRATFVGAGTKIDNLVQIGHNAQIGRDCLLCGQVAIGGSARLGDRVVLGGKGGVSDNISVGDDVVAGAGTIIMSNAPAGRAMFGTPAIRMDQQIEAWKHMRRLGRLFAQVAELRQAATKARDTD
ncbi:MAG: UDP-3-O-(3-hydroxymyristoyl)glucosamine N-acyltransferase [Alphaproteobacteria bacterium HGW-Alphaproteobacteria-4]|jgi:UDP-3-O-[3-hydroxymyristoyl] glucosamine N-acyltransferase|nr:MAG: UDP-3-O-(3-hydroxymyristoyl)glucosamine N-acyltransferase [Alphaproteobacteria bacterium HGW-Alphaproteobacteria-4]